MKVLLLILPVALFLGGGFLVSFLVFSARGDFDDLETPAHRILIDEEE